MGLPISNWIFVDDTHYAMSHELKDISRPKMLISHLSELSGITRSEKNIEIRGYTQFEEIFQSDVIPEYLKVVLRKARTEAMIHYTTLGCYLSSYTFDRFLYPLFVATKSQFVLKSYMKERVLDFVQFAKSGHLQIANYNEIIYELRMPLKNYTYITFDSLDTNEIQNDFKFSYFIGANIQKGIVQEFDMALMLPNKTVMYFEETGELFKGKSIVDILQLKDVVYTNIYKSMVNLRLQLKYRQYAKKVFDEIIWRPIDEMIKGDS
jgi:CO/xanthine dehydrogenase FAD-binding subunit